MTGSRPSVGGDTILPDTGCQYGGPSCLSCALPECVWDMDGFAFKRLQVKRGGPPREFLENEHRRACQPRQIIARELGVSTRTISRWRAQTRES